MIDKNQEIRVRPNGSLDVVTINHEKTMTQQQYKDECDINNIMKKYQQTGDFPTKLQQGVYADLTTITDYQDMLHQIQLADEAFNSLSAPIRAKFQNDPSQLLTFIQD